MQVSYAAIFANAVEVSCCFPPLMECFYPSFGLCMQLIQLSEENRVGWTGFCTGWLYAIFLSIVAKSALGGYASLFFAAYHTKGA